VTFLSVIYTGEERRVSYGKSMAACFIEPQMHDRAVGDVADPGFARQTAVIGTGHGAGSAAIGNVSRRSNLSMSRSSLHICGM
jgi:hypothetical protein